MDFNDEIREALKDLTLCVKEAIKLMKLKSELLEKVIMTLSDEEAEDGIN